MLVPIITRITIQDVYRYNLLTSAIDPNLIDKFKWFNLKKQMQDGKSYDLGKTYFNLKKIYFPSSKFL